MVLHTLRALARTPELSGVTIVVAPDDTQMQALLTQHATELSAVAMQAVPIGGATRAASVLAGLRHLSELGAADTDWVLVHDAARCVIAPEDIRHLIQRCRDDAVGGLLAVPLADTLKSAQAQRATGTLARDDKWQAQTPQMFRLGALRQALVQAEAAHFEGITDEASAMERLGHQPLLVAAQAHNFKVTYPQDFELAEALLSLRQSRSRDT